MKYLKLGEDGILLSLRMFVPIEETNKNIGGTIMWITRSNSFT
jgi:hypothetical protein